MLISQKNCFEVNEVSVTLSRIKNIWKIVISNNSELSWIWISWFRKMALQDWAHEKNPLKIQKIVVMRLCRSQIILEESLNGDSITSKTGTRVLDYPKWTHLVNGSVKLKCSLLFSYAWLFRLNHITKVYFFI